MSKCCYFLICLYFNIDLDQDGCLIYIEIFGGIDLIVMYKIIISECMFNNFVVEYECVVDFCFFVCFCKVGYFFEICCFIIDFKGVVIICVFQVYFYVCQVFVIFQNYYFECFGKMYFINVFWGFFIVWGVVKGWFDFVIVQKIYVFGSGYQFEVFK